MIHHCAACGALLTLGGQRATITGPDDTGRAITITACHACADGYTVTSLPTLAAFMRANAGMWQYDPPPPYRA